MNWKWIVETNKCLAGRLVISQDKNLVKMVANVREVIHNTDVVCIILGYVPYKLEECILHSLGGGQIQEKKDNSLEE